MEKLEKDLERAHQEEAFKRATSQFGLYHEHGRL